MTILPQSDGFVLTMSRDELRTRAETGLFQCCDLGICYPVDGASGGTWVGVSQQGFAMALLNRYQEPSRDDATTRGALISAALRQGSAEQARSFMQGITPTDYNPFDCVLVTAVATHRFCWNGKELSESIHHRPMMLSSSSERLEQVIDYRRSLFDDWQRQYTNSPMDVDRFHLAQDGTMVHSAVLMSRETTHTKSLVQVLVTSKICQLQYFDERALIANQRLSDMSTCISWRSARMVTTAASISSMAAGVM